MATTTSINILNATITSVTSVSALVSEGMATSSSSFPTPTDTTSTSPSPAAQCMVGPFTCDQQTFIQVATRLSGSLSLIGTVAIMISYILFARFRTSSNKLLLFANMGEFCIALMCVLSM